MITYSKFFCLYFFIVIVSCVYNSDTSVSFQNKSTISFNSKVKVTTVRRIFGGRLVKKINKFPYMAFTTRTSFDTKVNKTYVIFCGASILSPRHLLTAAHCLVECSCPDESELKTNEDNNSCVCSTINPQSLDVFVGSNIPKNAKKKLKVKKMHIHPQHQFYDEDNLCTHNYDIAVLELDDPITFGKDVSAVKLPPPVLPQDNNTLTGKLVEKGKKCEILGWGKTTKKPLPYLSKLLKVARVPLINIKKCSKHIETLRGQKFTEGDNKELCPLTQFCSYDAQFKNSACEGDSGGPIICNGMQLGVISWGATTLCIGPHQVGVYTKVDVNVGWIKDIIKRTGG